MTGDELHWLGQVTEAVFGQFFDGRAILAYTYDATQADRVTIRSTATRDWDAELIAVGNQVALGPSDNGALVQVLRRGFVDMLGRSPRALRRAGLPESQVRAYARRLQHGFRQLRLADEYWINAQDPTYFGCCFIVPSRERKRFLPLEAAQWRRVAARVSAAFRMRRQLAALDPRRPTPEAVLRPDGRVEHAEEPAQDRAARNALRRAVVALDKARGGLRRSDPDRAVALWQAMVAGRWSLVDHFDSGRDAASSWRTRRTMWRFRTCAAFAGERARWPAHAAMGHSNKVIARTSWVFRSGPSANTWRVPARSSGRSVAP